MNKDICPKCGSDLKGDPIPKKHKHLYEKGETFFSRRIGVYSLEKDKTVCWRCPDCGYEWEK